ncbi:MAG: hypothetical protein ABIQ95_15495, partial [Bdellovibrionia bacterium]
MFKKGCISTCLVIIGLFQSVLSGKSAQAAGSARTTAFTQNAFGDTSEPSIARYRETIRNVEEIDPIAAEWLLREIESTGRKQQADTHQYVIKNSLKEDLRDVNAIIELAVRTLSLRQGGVGGMRIGARQLDNLI